jgi:hypothetical protein
LLYAVLDRAHAANPIELLIHGAAQGADTLAKEWAKKRGVQDAPFPPDWSNLNVDPCVIRYDRDGVPYNAAAGGIRNQRMLDEGKPHLVIAFPGGTGTADMARRAKGAKVGLVRVKANSESIWTNGR